MREVTVEGLESTTRVAALLARAATAMGVPVEAEVVALRYEARLLRSEAMLGEAGVGARGVVDVCVWEGGGMRCFCLGGQPPMDDLRLQVQDAEARLIAETRRHAEANARFEAETRRHAGVEALWKADQQRLIQSEAHLKAEVERLRTQVMKYHTRTHALAHTNRTKCGLHCQLDDLG